LGESNGVLQQAGSKEREEKSRAIGENKINEWFWGEFMSRGKRIGGETPVLKEGKRRT